MCRDRDTNNYRTQVGFYSRRQLRQFIFKNRRTFKNAVLLLLQNKFQTTNTLNL
nr:hypothetical protein GZ17A3_42 [uncultured archaeon GZfos17A3]